MEKSKTDFLIIRTRDKFDKNAFRMIKCCDILFVRMSDEFNRTDLYVKDGTVINSYVTIKQYEDYLNSEMFFRSSKGCLININNIDLISEWFSNSIKAVIYGHEIEFSRRQSFVFLSNTA